MKWKLFALLLLGSSAFANVLREMSFDEKVNAASVVLIGIVEPISPQPKNSAPRYALVRVESLLKGAAPEIIRVQTVSLVHEKGFRVTTGRRYLFLLYVNKDLHISVNGRFGVIPVDGKPF
jgi:hypothetical protein